MYLPKQTASALQSLLYLAGIIFCSLSAVKANAQTCTSYAINYNIIPYDPPETLYETTTTACPGLPTQVYPSSATGVAFAYFYPGAFDFRTPDYFHNDASIFMVCNGVSKADGLNFSTTLNDGYFNFNYTAKVSGTTLTETVVTTNLPPPPGETETFNDVATSVYSILTGQQILSDTSSSTQIFANVNGCQQTVVLSSSLSPTSTQWRLLQASPITIASSLPAGTENISYVSTATVSGGVSPIVTVNGLPAGLTADASGHISGTPASGTAANSPYQVTISASDSAGDHAGPVTLPLKISKNCAVPVTAITQLASPWGPLPYDHLGLGKNGKQITIAGRGCALTSLNMALNFEGESWNPGTLNSLLNATGGYDTQGVVQWLTATLASNGGRTAPPLVYDNLGGTVNSDVDLAGAEQAVEDEVCSSTPLPVIVGVRSPKTGKYFPAPGHFVLVTGETIASDGSKFFTINDPAGYSTILGTDPSTGKSGYTNSNGDPEFQTRGVVHDPTDLTELSVGVDAIVNLIVTDPNAFQTGFGSASPNPIQNIPHSAATVDELDDDVTGEAGNPVQGVTINSPAPGVFQFSLTGTALGQYSLVVSTGASDGSIQTSSISGLANVGTTSKYELSYNSTPGTPQQVTLLATFASILADINSARQLGLIDNGGIANSFTQKIEAAQNATGPARNNILSAFQNEVNAQSGKHVTGIAPQVLLQDADSLISQPNLLN